MIWTELVMSGGLNKYQLLPTKLNQLPATVVWCTCCTRPSVFICCCIVVLCVLTYRGLLWLLLQSKKYEYEFIRSIVCVVYIYNITVYVIEMQAPCTYMCLIVIWMFPPDFPLMTPFLPPFLHSLLLYSNNDIDFL